MHIEVEFYNLLSHIFFHLVSFLFDLHKLLLENSLLELIPPLSNFLLVLLCLAELLLQALTHALDHIVAVLLELNHSLSILSQILQQCRLPLFEGVLYIFHMCLNAAEFRLEA